jgi:Uma2 family endonuclease
VILTQRRVVQPDILYITNERRSIIQDRVRGAPDLIIEVVSPGSWRQDHVDKRALYEQFGVEEYWIVDPEAEMIEVFALVDGSYHLFGRYGLNEKAQSKLLPGFETSVKDIIS